eukprot:3774516-Pleurochrysis_carterae.AAC.1
MRQKPSATTSADSLRAEKSSEIGRDKQRDRQIKSSEIGREKQRDWPRNRHRCCILTKKGGNEDKGGAPAEQR